MIFNYFDSEYMGLDIHLFQINNELINREHLR